MTTVQIPKGSITKRCRKCSRYVPTQSTPRSCPGCAARLQRDTISWGWRIRIPAADGGRPTPRSQSGFDTERAARDSLDELRASLRAGSYVTPQQVSVAAYLQTWLQSIPHEVSEGTWNSYESHVRNYLSPTLGEVRLQALARSDIRKALSVLRASGRRRGTGGLAPKTVHNIFLTLHVALAAAVKDGLLLRNPADDAHRIGKDEMGLTAAEQQSQWWRQPEIELFLSHVAPDDLFAMWHVFCWTGARRGEVAGMRWQDVDLEAGTWEISRQWRKGRGGQPGMATLKAAKHGKPNRQRRVVALVPDTVEALRRHRAAQNRLRLLMGGEYADTDLIFCRADGSPLHPDGITQRFERHVRSAGLRRIRLHDLRHSHATWCLDSGMPVHQVSARLGHSSIQVTVDTYGHDDIDGQRNSLGTALRRAAEE